MTDNKDYEELKQKTEELISTAGTVAGLLGKFVRKKGTELKNKLESEDFQQKAIESVKSFSSSAMESVSGFAEKAAEKADKAVESIDNYISSLDNDIRPPQPPASSPGPASVVPPAANADNILRRFSEAGIPLDRDGETEMIWDEHMQLYRSRFEPFWFCPAHGEHFYQCCSMSRGISSLPFPEVWDYLVRGFSNKRSGLEQIAFFAEKNDVLTRSFIEFVNLEKYLASTGARLIPMITGKGTDLAGVEKLYNAVQSGETVQNVDEILASKAAAMNPPVKPSMQPAADPGPVPDTHIYYEPDTDPDSDEEEFIGVRIITEEELDEMEGRTGAGDDDYNKIIQELWQEINHEVNYWEMDLLQRSIWETPIPRAKELIRENPDNPRNREVQKLLFDLDNARYQAEYNRFLMYEHVIDEYEL